METVRLTDQNFDKQISFAPVALVDFTAEWCPPCRAMTPVVDNLAKEWKGKAVISQLDVDANPATAARFGVRNLPTFLLLKNGLLVERIVGAVPHHVLRQKLATLAFSKETITEAGNL